MTNPPFKIDVSPRIQRLPPYLFGRINKLKYDKRVAGIDPQLHTPKAVGDQIDFLVFHTGTEDNRQLSFALSQ